MKRTVKEDQSALDIAILSYGTPEHYFSMCKLNGKKTIPPLVEIGEELTYEEAQADKPVLKLMNKEVVELATVTENTLEEILNDFNSDFNTDFL